MKSQKKVLMTALSAGVFALGSFATMSAYAVDSCLVCWSPDSSLCQRLDMTIQGPETVAVMWMSCYEGQFRNGIAVNETSCGETFVAPKYEAYIDFPPDIPDFVDYPDDGNYPADNAWWYTGKSCQDLRDLDLIPEWVPLAADSLTYTPICLVRNDGSDNEDVAGIGELAPGGTGLLNEACPAN